MTVASSSFRSNSPTVLTLPSLTISRMPFMCSFGNFFMFSPSSFFSAMEMTVLAWVPQLSLFSFLGFFSTTDLVGYSSVGRSVWLQPLCSGSAGSAVILRQYDQNSEVRRVISMSEELKMQLLVMILETSAWNWVGVMYWLVRRLFSIVERSIGSLTISVQCGMPKAMGSTGSLNSHEVREFLRRFRMRTQGFNDSLNPSQLFLRATSFCALYFQQTAFQFSSLDLLLERWPRLAVFFNAAGGFGSSCVVGGGTLVDFLLGSAGARSSSFDLELGSLRGILGSSWNEQELGSSLARYAACADVSSTLNVLAGVSEEGLIGLF